MTTLGALLNSTESNSTLLADLEIENATTSTAFTSSTSALVTSTTPLTTFAPSTTDSTPAAEDSHSVFLLCTVLFFVAIALVAKVIYSNRNRYRMLDHLNPNWRLSTSRSSAAGAFAPPAADPFQNSPGGFGSAHYTAVAPSSTDHFAQAHQEWERQFFDDDPTVERTSSRLELRR